MAKLGLEGYFISQLYLVTHQLFMLFSLYFVLFQPERILGDEYSIRSELWSLGVSLLEVTEKILTTTKGSKIDQRSNTKSNVLNISN